MKNLIQPTLLLGMLTILLFSTTNAFAVIGHPVIDKPALSKQEKKLKRQQKLFNFVEKIQRSKLIKKHNILLNSTDCDTIVLNNGDRIAAMIFDIGGRRIQYIRCNQVNPRKVSILRILIKEVRYQNGTVDSFAKPENLDLARVEDPDSTPLEAKEIKKAKLLGILFGTIIWTAGFAVIIKGALSGWLIFITFFLILSSFWIYRKKGKKFHNEMIQHTGITFMILSVLLAALLLWILISLSISW